MISSFLLAATSISALRIEVRASPGHEIETATLELLREVEGELVPVPTGRQRKTLPLR